MKILKQAVIDNGCLPVIDHDGGIIKFGRVPRIKLDVFNCKLRPFQSLKLKLPSPNKIVLARGCATIQFFVESIEQTIVWWGFLPLPGSRVVVRQKLN